MKKRGYHSNMPLVTHCFSLFSKTILDLTPIVNPVLIGLFFLQYAKSSALSKLEISKYSFLLSFYAFLLLCLILIVGVSIFHFIGITLPYIRIAGGLLIFSIGWSIINNTQKESKIPSLKDGIFYPLTLPITIGGGSIAVIINLATEIDQNSFSANFFEDISVMLGILCVSIMIFLCCCFSAMIKYILKPGGVTALSILFAFILLPLGLIVIWEGLSPLITSVIGGPLS